MEFKHAFHVFVDNFATTYKLLIYRLIVAAVTVGLCCAVVIPTLNNILSTAQYEKLYTTFTEFWASLVSLNTEEMQGHLEALKEALKSFRHLIADKSWLVALDGVFFGIIYFIHSYLVAVGNYVTGSLINDKMAMHAKTPFTFTLFKNVKGALLYSIIYAPIAFVYDLICLLIMWAVVILGLKTFTFTVFKVFLIAVLFFIFSAIKFTFTVDWLPCLIHSKKNNRSAMAYTFKRSGKRIAPVLSTAVVIKLIIIALNVATGLFTFGAGLLITIPAGGIIQLCYSFVYYFDSNKLKYFVDEYTVIGPKKDTPPTMEEFFRGDN